MNRRTNLPTVNAIQTTSIQTLHQAEATPMVKVVPRQVLLRRVVAGQTRTKHNHRHQRRKGKLVSCHALELSLVFQTDLSFVAR